MVSVAVHVVLAEDGPLVNVLERAGATVEVLPMDRRARNLRKDRIRIGGVPFSAAWATVTYTVRLARRLRQLKPDLVHTNTLKAALYGGVAARGRACHASGTSETGSLRTTFRRSPSP